MKKTRTRYASAGYFDRSGASLLSSSIGALLYSLIQSCKLNNIDQRSYLEFVLNQVHLMRRGKIDPAELLPHTINQRLLKLYKLRGGVLEGIRYRLAARR